MTRTYPWAAFVLFASLVLLPIAYLISLSFVARDGSLTTDFYTLYLSGTLWFLLYKSLIIAGGTTLLSLGIGIPLGILVARTDLWLKPMWAALMIVPLLLPPYMMTICWFYLLTPESWINVSLLPALGLGAINFHTLDGYPGCIFSETLSYYPIIALLTWLGVRTPDPALEEAGRMATNPWRAFRLLTLPAAAPYILTGAVFVFFFSMINYSVPYQFSIGGIFISEIHSQYQGLHNNAQAAALTLPFLLGSVCLLWAERRALRRYRSAVRSTSTAPPPGLRLGVWQGASQAGAFLVTVLSTLGPLAVLVWMAWPFDQMAGALESCRPEIVNTLTLAGIGGTLTLALAAGVATGARRRGVWAKVMDFSGILPLAFPPMSLGIALILLWNRSAVFGMEAGWVGQVSDVVYGTILVMVFVTVGRCFPFAMRPVFYGLGSLDPSLEEAARMEGAGPARSFFHITLPLTWRSFALAWFLAFMFALGEYDAIHLVQQAGNAMLAPRIIGSFHNFRHDIVSNVSLVMILLVIFPILIYLLIPRRVNRKAGP